MIRRIIPTFHVLRTVDVECSTARGFRWLKEWCDSTSVGALWRPDLSKFEVYDNVRWLALLHAAEGKEI